MDSELGLSQHNGLKQISQWFGREMGRRCPLQNRGFRIGLAAVVMLVLLRITVGWHFLYQGIAKLEDEDFTSANYLWAAKGPLGPLYRKMLPDPYGRTVLTLPREDIGAKERTPSKKSPKEKPPTKTPTGKQPVNEQSSKKQPSEPSPAKPDNPPPTPANNTQPPSTAPKTANPADQIQVNQPSSGLTSQAPEEEDVSDNGQPADGPDQTEEGNSGADSANGETADSASEAAQAIQPDANADPQSSGAADQPAPESQSAENQDTDTSTSGQTQTPGGEVSQQDADQEQTSTAPEADKQNSLTEPPSNEQPKPEKPTQDQPKPQNEQTAKDKKQSQSAPETEEGEEQAETGRVWQRPWPQTLFSPWESYARQFEEHYALDEDSKKRVEEILKARKSLLKNYLDDKQEKIDYYLEDVEALEQMEDQPWRSVRFQQERIWNERQELQKIVQPWLDEIQRQSDLLKQDLQNLLSEEDRQKQGAFFERPYTILGWMDLLLPYILVAAGACLIVGFLTRIAAWGGAFFLLNIVLSQLDFGHAYPPPHPSAGPQFIVNKEFIEMVALMVIGTAPLGRWGGVDYFFWAIGRALFGSARSGS